MSQSDAAARPYALSMTGFLLAALGFCLVVVQFVAGPFAPQEYLTLGEMAGNMARDAVDGFLRRSDADGAAAVPWAIDRIMLAGAMVAAVLGIVLGVAGLLRHEAPRAVGSAIVMGGIAIAAQFFATTLVLIIGAVLILGLFAMIGGIFSV